MGRYERRCPPGNWLLRQFPSGMKRSRRLPSRAIGMEQSAVSHQLRLLRNLGLVIGTRSGRSIVYSLYDNHVAQLLDQAIYHSEHLRLGIPDRPQTATSTKPTAGVMQGVWRDSR